MDNYTEQILDCKPATRTNVAFSLSIVFMILGALCVLAINFFLGIIFLFIGGGIFYFSKNGLNSEFEYLFINGDCDIARISNKSSRRNEYSFKESDVLRVLKYDDPKAKNELEINKKLNIRDFTSGDEDMDKNWYVFFVNVKNSTDAVVMELNEKNVEHCASTFKQKFEVKR